MATYDEAELKSQIRNLTDYDQFTLSAEDLTEIVDMAKSDIMSDIDVYDINWYNSEDLTAHQALFWTSCLFILLKAREADGADIKFENLDVETVKAAGRRYELNGVLWYEKASKYRNRLRPQGSETFPYGIAYVERENRVYGDTTAGGPE